MPELLSIVYGQLYDEGLYRTVSSSIILLNIVPTIYIITIQPEGQNYDTNCSVDNLKGYYSWQHRIYFSPT